jgi:hypothetical protein
MDTTAYRRAQQYIKNRKQHPAWLLLASPRAPLILGCLSSLFEYAEDGVAEEQALHALSEMLSEFSDQADYGISPDSTAQLAGKELREWLKRGLVTERGQRVYATDAFATAKQFVESLDDRIMTSTASRLSVVQREIAELEIGLNPNPQSRIAALTRQIESLEAERARAEAGEVVVLSKAAAVERIREVFALANGLRADFRRVEDSWREADRALRQSIVTEQYHRGAIVDRLLDGQDALLQTPEGRVFDAFQAQLRQAVELDNMQYRIRTILKHPATLQALSKNQITDLRLMKMRLVNESQSVLQARARSERDVKGFLKTGLAAEHHRVGAMLNEIFATALNLDWTKQRNKRADSPLPPIAIALGALPLAERLRFKQLDTDAAQQLDLTAQAGDLSSIDDDFWQAFNGLDREAVIAETLAVLAKIGTALTLAELAEQLPPTHDLETFSLWLGMAQEAGVNIYTDTTQAIEVRDSDQRQWLFSVPTLALSTADLDGIDWDI